MTAVTTGSRPPDMVGKALSLLTLLGEYPYGVGASELARRLGLPLSTAHRLLGALSRDGYTTFDQDTKRYSLGLRVFQLAQSVGHARGFIGMTRSILEQVSVDTREATLLAVLDGERLLYVHSIAGPQQVSVVGHPGGHGPLHCTSLGKVLVAFAAPDMREQLAQNLPLEQLAPHSITDRKRFRDEIELVCSHGYATADEEHEAGIRAISVPVFGNGNAVAAVSTAAPAYRVSLEQLVEHRATLNEAAKSLAAVMPHH